MGAAGGCFLEIPRVSLFLVNILLFGRFLSVASQDDADGVRDGAGLVFTAFTAYWLHWGVTMWEGSAGMGLWDGRC